MSKTIEELYQELGKLVEAGAGHKLIGLDYKTPKELDIVEGRRYVWLTEKEIEK